MKNLLLLVFTTMIILIGCNKDDSPTETASLTKEQMLKNHNDLLTSKLEKINEAIQNRPTIETGENKEKQAIEDRSSCNRVVICHNGHYNTVNKSAVPAHLAHGDQLTCCQTSCINQSEELINGGPFEWYYNGVEDDCFGYQSFNFILVAIGNGSYEVGAYIFTDEGGTTYYSVYSHNHVNHSGCFAEVTEAEYNCATDYLLSYIEANSCIPNLCSFYF